MQFQENFKFLNYQVINRKNAADLPADKKSFVKLNLLDKDNNPCSFMVFDNDIVKNLQESKYAPLFSVPIIFEVVYRNDNWRVNMINFVTK